MSDIYCGSLKIPKGKRQGTMVECVNKGNISYWGLHKVDHKLIEAKKLKKIKTNNVLEIRLEMTKLNARIKKLLKDIEYGKKRKEPIEKLKKMQEKAKITLIKLKELKAKKDQLENKINKASKKKEKEEEKKNK
jgi:hypothetical protein